MSRLKPSVTPEVSVIIPAYNAAETLAETLASVKMQTFSDWEIIVVDDGSRDRSIDIAREAASVEPRIRLIQQCNAGPSAARNNGVSQARGSVVAFLDADDTWLPQHLELAMKLLRCDEKLGVAFAPCRIVDEHGRDTGQRTRASTLDVTAGQILGCNPTATCSSLVVRKSVFADAGPMREDMVHAEDQEWLFRVIQSGWMCRSHDSCTVNYRSSPRGLSSDVPRMFAGWKTFVDVARQTAPDVVAKDLASATAAMHLYYARRLMRDGIYSVATLRHVGTACKAAPGTVAMHFWRLLGTRARPLNR